MLCTGECRWGSVTATSLCLCATVKLLLVAALTTDCCSVWPLSMSIIACIALIGTTRR